MSDKPTEILFDDGRKELLVYIHDTLLEISITKKSNGSDLITLIDKTEAIKLRDFLNEFIGESTNDQT